MCEKSIDYVKQAEIALTMLVNRLLSATEMSAEQAALIEALAKIKFNLEMAVAAWVSDGRWGGGGRGGEAHVAGPGSVRSRGDSEL